jgi:hypothetical protein
MLLNHKLKDAQNFRSQNSRSFYEGYIYIYGFCSVNGLYFSDHNYQLKIQVQKNIFNARTGG